MRKFSNLFSQMLLLATFASTACAEAGKIPPRELSQSGLHFEAVTEVAETAEPSLESQLAAARSSWALGLPELAKKYWDQALANETLNGDERVKEHLVRAILELQEGNLEEARAVAEKTVSNTENSQLRAQLWLVIAESLRLQGAVSQSEGYYQKAQMESEGETKSEASYLLGECQLKLGRINDARYSFTSVGAESKFSLPAIKRLISIDLRQHSYEGVLTWVKEGRGGHPSEFNDPWVGYAVVLSSLELGRKESALRELDQLKARHSSDEPWYQLASAAVEASLLRDVVGKDKKPEGNKQERNN